MIKGLIILPPREWARRKYIIFAAFAKRKKNLNDVRLTYISIIASIRTPYSSLSAEYTYMREKETQQIERRSD